MKAIKIYRPGGLSGWALTLCLFFCLCMVASTQTSIMAMDNLLQNDNAVQTNNIDDFSPLCNNGENISDSSRTKAPPALSTELTGTISGNNTYKASTITSSQIISSGSTTYLAEKEITLKPGFEVKSRAEFQTIVSRDYFHLEVTMMTYNIKGINSLCITHGEYIKKSKAAVVSVQEIMTDVGGLKFDNLKSSSGLEGEMLTTISKWYGDYGIGTLWNPDVVGNPVDKSNQLIDCPNDRDGIRAFMVTEFQDFCFVATHYSLNETHRVEMSNAILNNTLVKKCLNAGKPVYIAGDMNAVKEDAPVKKFTDYGFKVLNTPVGKDAKTGARFIDLILGYNTDSYHRVINSGVPIDDFNQWDKDNISDHYPYYVKVQIK